MVKEPLSPPFSFSSPSPVLPFGGMVAKPVAGWLADRLARQRLVFLLALLLTGQLTLANFYLLLFPLSPLFPVFRVFYPALSTFSAVLCLSIASTPLPTGGFYFSIQLVSSIPGSFLATFHCSHPFSLLKVGHRGAHC